MVKNLEALRQSIKGVKEALDTLEKRAKACEHDLGEIRAEIVAKEYCHKIKREEDFRRVETASGLVSGLRWACEQFSKDPIFKGDLVSIEFTEG